MSANTILIILGILLIIAFGALIISQCRLYKALSRNSEIMNKALKRRSEIINNAFSEDTNNNQKRLYLE
jgi:hypothetical protein